MTIGIGDRAPEFSARATDGKNISLASFRGKYLVLYFFPKAFTPGCTKEARRFRDNHMEIRELGAEVVGVSLDEPTVQCEFAERQKLAFPLIADSSRTVSTAYGVLRRFLPITKRVTFVIDPDGKVAARFEHELQVNKHLDNVLRFLREAKSPS
ncbi:MAG TPA: peroxiredoxin [Myxococcota bacterium]|nr:peroxiredoxin [Myxococcota bacterium]